MQHYGICFSVLKIYAKLNTLSCWLPKIQHWLWCCISQCITSPDVK